MWTKSFLRLNLIFAWIISLSDCAIKKKVFCYCSLVVYIFGSFWPSCWPIYVSGRFWLHIVCMYFTELFHILSNRLLVDVHLVYDFFLGNVGKTSLRSVGFFRKWCFLLDMVFLYHVQAHRTLSRRRHELTCNFQHANQRLLSLAFMNLVIQDSPFSEKQLLQIINYHYE